MYALIYDEHQLDHPQKKVISVHRRRETAEAALERRQKSLQRRVWDCHTRIVWVHRPVKAGDLVEPSDYETWRPGEAIPEGEVFGDSD